MSFLPPDCCLGITTRRVVSVCLNLESPTVHDVSTPPNPDHTRRRSWWRGPLFLHILAKRPIPKANPSDPTLPRSTLDGRRNKTRQTKSVDDLEQMSKRNERILFKKIETHNGCDHYSWRTQFGKSWLELPLTWEPGWLNQFPAKKRQNSATHVLVDIAPFPQSCQKVLRRKQTLSRWSWYWCVKRSPDHHPRHRDEGNLQFVVPSLETSSRHLHVRGALLAKHMEEEKVEVKVQEEEVEDKERQWREQSEDRRENRQSLIWTHTNTWALRQCRVTHHYKCALWTRKRWRVKCTVYIECRTDFLDESM